MQTQVKRTPTTEWEYSHFGVCERCTLLAQSQEEEEAESELNVNEVCADCFEPDDVEVDDAPSLPHADVLGPVWALLGGR